MLLMAVGHNAYGMEWTEATIKEALSKMTIAQVNEKNNYGHTMLHIAVLSPEERDEYYPQFAHVLSAEDRKPENYDLRQAHALAVCIASGAKIDIRDNKKHAVWYYAKKNKATYPHIYNVIMAGRVVEVFESGIGPKNGQTFTVEELIDASNDIRKQAIIWMDLETCIDALKTLDEYAKKK